MRVLALIQRWWRASDSLEARDRCLTARTTGSSSDPEGTGTAADKQKPRRAFAFSRWAHCVSTSEEPPQLSHPRPCALLLLASDFEADVGTGTSALGWGCDDRADTRRCKLLLDAVPLLDPHLGSCDGGARVSTLDW